MKKALLAVAALACIGSAAHAAENAGGTLILALSEGTVYSAGINYCGGGTAADCDGAVAQGPLATALLPNVINCYAAFGGGGGRLSGVTFGVDYDANSVAIIDLGACGDFELADGNWPAAGSGTAVTWGAPQTSNLVDVYWFGAYSAYAGYTLSLVPHPSQGGNFANDNVPSDLDPIAGFGVFGFETAGSAPCPSAQPETEACCFDDGSCADLLADVCVRDGGTPQGPGTACAGTQCPQPRVGACCTSAGCIITTAADCQGDYQGDGTTCDPDPCTPVPTIESSWGGVKNIYR